MIEQRGQLVQPADHLHAFDVAADLRSRRLDNADGADGRTRRRLAGGAQCFGDRPVRADHKGARRMGRLAPEDGCEIAGRPAPGPEPHHRHQRQPDRHLQIDRRQRIALKRVRQHQDRQRHQVGEQHRLEDPHHVVHRRVTPHLAMDTPQPERESRRNAEHDGREKVQPVRRAAAREEIDDLRGRIHRNDASSDIVAETERLGLNGRPAPGTPCTTHARPPHTPGSTRESAQRTRFGGAEPSAEGSALPRTTS